MRYHSVINWFQGSSAQKRRNNKRSRSGSTSGDDIPTKQKISKWDSLKPIATHLTTLLSVHGLPVARCEEVVGDVIERLVTAGFGWDKILQYHAKVKWYIYDSITK